MTKNVVITGGAVGIGFWTMHKLYFNHGFNIIFGGPSEAQNQQAIQLIEQQKGKKAGSWKDKQPKIQSHTLDLSQKQSIEEFSHFVAKQFAHIDLLINNAGLMMKDLQLNKDFDVEMTLAINFFGPFYLTKLLFPLIKKSPEARIVNLSSETHYNCEQDPLSNLRCDEQKKGFGPMAQYAKSKLFHVLFTNRMARMLSHKGLNVKAVSIHPGRVKTRIGDQIWWAKMIKTVAFFMFYTPEQGAELPEFVGAIMEFKELKNGEFYWNDKKVKEMDKRGRDQQLQDQLWELSEKITGCEFSI